MASGQDLIQSLSVLYVEDDPDIRLLISSYLSKSVGKLKMAENGEEGIERFITDKPDLVITDIMMPVMDGLQMATAIRKLDANVPIIVTTAHNDEEYFIRSIDLGIDRYVLKPTKPHFLIEAVQKCAQLLSSHREQETANRYIRFLLDAQPNLLMVIAHGEVEYLNQAFLDFLGPGIMENFKRDTTSMGEFMVTAQGVKLSECGDWVAMLTQSPEKFPVLYLRSGDEEPETLIPFALKTNSLPELNRHLFSFIDITLIEQEKRALENQAFTDVLTGVCNRARLQGLLNAELQRAHRHGLPMAVILGDIDHFKRINDTFGHQTGDDVLKHFARLLQENVRAEDIVARWGGEEFMIVSPQSTREKTRQLAEKLRRIIQQQTFGQAGEVTCSFGVAETEPHDTIRSLTERADKALYQAKTKGRNRVETDLIHVTL